MSMDMANTIDGDLLGRFGLDIAAIFILIRLIYYPVYRRTDLFLTFFSFNIVIFMIAYVLNSTEMSMGAAFGLFAVFSMLRYRTEGISTINMTYLFLGIALGLVLAIGGLGLAGLAFAAGTLLLLTFLLERVLLRHREERHEVLYDNLAMVKLSSHPDLIADLKTRTGLDVRRVEIIEIDLLRECARLALYYRVNG
jgi:hypothetical protein